MEDFVILSVATLAAGFLRGLTGFGFALAAVPFYSLAVPPLYAVVMAQTLQIASAPLDIAQNFKKIDRKALGLLAMGALVGAPIGAFFATRLHPDVMRIAIAVFVLLGLAALVAKLSIRDGKGPALIAGGVAGLLAGLAAIPGPPAVAYFLGRRADAAVSRASLLVFFAFSAAVALSFMAATTDLLRVEMFVSAAVNFPVLFLSSWLGAKLFARINSETYRLAALAVLLISALLTGAKGAAGLML